MLSLAENIFSDWELKFLNDIAQQAEDTLALTRKEREKLKDSARLDEARVELDEDDEAFIEPWRPRCVEPTNSKPAQYDARIWLTDGYLASGPRSTAEAGGALGSGGAVCQRDQRGCSGGALCDCNSGASRARASGFPQAGDGLLLRSESAQEPNRDGDQSQASP
jgi:hypothetical protein